MRRENPATESMTVVWERPQQILLQSFSDDSKQTGYSVLLGVLLFKLCVNDVIIR